MAQVELQNVSKRFLTTGRAAVEEVSLTVADREFVVLVGPSGCGKTTTLRMIAGLETPTSGKIKIGDRVVNDVAPKDRDIAMVFQNYALYPHMTIYRNIAFGLIMRKFPKAEIDRRVREAAALLGIADLLDRKPKALSGGQRQRVALGRAIVRQPQVFLFDEPLSNLDAAMRVATRGEIKKLHQRLGATMVYVTHDQVEAMTMGDRIVVMHEGKVQQAGPPLEIYDRPSNKFVAGFIGSPAMNFLEGKIVESDGLLQFEKDSLRLPVAAPHVEALRKAAGAGSAGTERKITLGLRPEHFALAGQTNREGDWRPLTAKAEVVEPMGAEVYVTAAVEATTLTVRLEGHAQVKAGEVLELAADMTRARWFGAADGAAIAT